MSDEQEVATNETEGGENPSLRKNLSYGFRALRILRDSKSSGPLTPSTQAEKLPFLKHIVVNFVDPTSSVSSVTTADGKSVEDPPLMLYDKFSKIFERDYLSKLRFVPLQVFRSGSKTVVENLIVKTVMTKTHGGMVSFSDDVPWATPDGKDASDPTDWHWAPYCHVYFAACKNLEHYRNKVKPSIQAFVSQLESSGIATNSTTTPQSTQAPSSGNSTGNAQNSSQSSNSNSPPYVIIFVPSGERQKGDESPAKARRVGASVASRFAAARRMVQNRELPMQSGDSTHSGASIDSGEYDDVDSGHGSFSSGPSPILRLSRLERELLRRMTNDFPNGNVCSLSSLLNEEIEEKSSREKLENELLMQKAEWGVVIKSMATAIGIGFSNRCQRYDDELRRLDALRRGENKTDFHLSDFFLIKESFAFTHEQMHMPEESLLQYEELEAFIPPIEKETLDSGNELKNVTALNIESSTGDYLGFRMRLQEHPTLIPIAHYVEQYLFARQTALLFEMNRPTRVLERCLHFVNHSFQQKYIALKMKHQTEEGAQKVELPKDKCLEIEKWAFQFSWDVKDAATFYLNYSDDKVFPKTVCILTEFSFSRLKKIGELAFEEHPLHKEELELYEGLDCEWKPWQEQLESEPSDDGPKNEFDIDANFVESALSSTDCFRQRYIALARMIVEFNEICGRRRYAARLRLQMMNVFLVMGHKRKAAEQLRLIVHLYSKERWTYCYVALVFRLAGIQREIGAAIDYLPTLVRCFTKLTAQVAPPKAINALHDDFEKVVQSANVVGSHFKHAPLFSPIFGLEGLVSPPGSERNLLKKLYTVGDKVCLTLTLISYLPKEIEVDGVSMSLVPFRTYVAAMEDNTTIKDSDVFRVLSLKSPIEIKKGKNEFTFEWKPLASGQFIISEAVIQWKEVLFNYTAKELKRPTIRIDVVPSEPTQNLEVTPSFLLPGHEQPINFFFSAGSDVVKEGTLQLVASPGNVFRPFASEQIEKPWVSSSVAPLPPCLPGQTVKMSTVVKTSEKGDVQPVVVKVSTLYRYANDESGDSSSGYIETSLEAKIPTMSEHVVTLQAYNLVPYSVDRALVNITIKCNAAVPFKVKSWQLSLPSNLELSENGDLNEFLVGMDVFRGDRISFCFDCNIRSDVSIDTSSVSAPDSVLLVDLENEYSTVFKEPIKLNLSQFIGNRTKPPDMERIPVTIIPSASEGKVGAPLDISVTIDCTKVPAMEGKLVYVISSFDADWIVSGNIEGTLERSIKQIEFVGIPSKPGNIKHYPAIKVECRNKMSTTSLPVEVADAPPYKASFPSNHMSIAFPTGVSMRTRSLRFSNTH